MDDDTTRYTAQFLHDLKLRAEQNALLALETSNTKIQIRKTTNRLAYTIYLNGQQLSQYIRDYFANHRMIDSKNILSVHIAVSDGMTGIIDYGGEYSYLETVNGIRFPVTQEIIFDAINNLPEVIAAQSEATGITFELTGENERSATEYPIEICVVNILITKRHEIISENDLPDLLQQLFYIHTIDSCWFWNRSAAPAARAVQRLVESDQGRALANFITTVDPSNSMSSRNQLIDVGWQLIHHHRNWLVRNSSVIDALRQRAKGLTEPLCTELHSLAMEAASEDTRRKTR